MVEKTGVEKSGVGSSWFKSPGLKGLGLKLGVEKSRVEMSFNHLQDLNGEIDSIMTFDQCNVFHFYNTKVILII